MPELNKFENYDACMGTFGREAKFCYVKTALKPDKSSKLFNFIEEFSSNKKQHFRHDKLARGICINTCRKIIDDLGQPAAEKYFVEKFDFDYEVMKMQIERPNISKI